MNKTKTTILQNMYFFVVCFAEAFKYHKVRYILVVFYIISHYLFQNYFLHLKTQAISGILCGAAAFFYLIEATIKSILTLPIRNTAITIARLKYLDLDAQNTLQATDRLNFGTNYAGFKRLEIVFTGLERDILDLIKYGPFLLTSVLKLFQIFDNKITPALLMLFNLISILYCYTWYQMRQQVFKAEENTNHDFLKLFQNIDRIAPTEIKRNTESVIKKEIDLYVDAISAKQYYKLFVALPNVLFGILMLKFNQFNTMYFSGLIIFVVNWVRFSGSLISLIGMSSGIKVQTLLRKPVTKNNEIKIKDLNLFGLFKNFNCKIAEGERVVITGENGTGKTILLKLMAGQIQNRSVIPVSDYMMITNQSSIFQSEKHKLEENIIWQENFAKSYNHLLQKEFTSTGERIFLCIALILEYKPKVVFIDESLDLLSDDLLQEVFKIMDFISPTLVVVSHNQEVIQRFSNILESVSFIA